MSKITVVNVHGIVMGANEKATLKSVNDNKEEFEDAPDIESLVDNSQDTVEDKEAVGLKPVEDFKTKDALEEYGKEFGIDLNKTKTIANMYADLVEFVNA